MKEVVVSVCKKPERMIVDPHYGESGFRTTRKDGSRTYEFVTFYPHCGWVTRSQFFTLEEEKILRILPMFYK
ncbi:MAG: hypothetical protein WC761_07190 [Candidatus Paceibacterota bacterium]|jgi:hypothetical protein